MNDEYIGATEVAKRLGKHINTVRNWTKDGRLQSVQLPGSKRSQYRASDIERMVTDRGQPVSMIGSDLRTATLDFIDAENLDRWEGRRAQERLPELLRRLLARTPGITNASIRAGEGISVTGWDGVAASDGRAAFLPTGPIRFEAGTSSDYMKKAQSDYDNRVAAASGKPSAEHFVFVTNRRWKTKAAWEADREAEGMFQSVRVLDADDLIGWLEATPFVHLWISEVLGRRPTEVQTLDQWWAEFGANHELPPTEDLFLAGRAAEREELLAFLESASDKLDLAIRSTWASDSLAFAWAAVQGDGGGSAPLIVLIRTAEAWARLLPETSPAVVIPLFAEANVGLASRFGHKVLFALGSEATLRAGSRVMVLPRVDRQEAVRALQSAGHSWERSNRLAALFRRSPRAFIRETALDKRLATPKWAEPGPRASKPAMLALAGQWTARDDDRELVARLAGVDWTDIERALVELSNGDDPPFVRTGDAWRLAAPVETASMLFPLLTSSDIRRWGTVCADVITEPDPLRSLSETDRMMAPLRGIGRRYSRELRDGIATGVALMGQSEAAYPGGPSGEQIAEVPVASILASANGDPTGATWADISDSMRGLAEGAPRVFLDALDDALSGSMLSALFTEKPAAERSMFGASSSHTSLLWALEILGRSEQFFPQAVDSLARLVEIDDPPGTSSNRPINSIRGLVIPNTNSSAASVDERVAFMERLAAIVSASVAWEIALTLVPADRGLFMAPAAPEFRDWVPESAAVTPQHWERYLEGLVGCLISLAGHDLSRWAAIVDYLDPFPKASFTALTDALRTSIGTNTSGSGASELWSELHTLVAKHQEFRDSHWFMGEERLAVLDDLMSLLPEPESANKYKLLFGWFPHLDGIDREDHAVYTKALQEARMAAVSETISDGWDALVKLIDSVETPGALAYIVSDLGLVELQANFFALLDSPDEPRSTAAGAYVNSEFLKRGPDWLAEVLRAPGLVKEQRRQKLVLHLPPASQHWEALDALDPELSAYYWANMSPWGVDPSQLAQAFVRLTTAGRPSAALVIVQAGLHHDPPVVFDPKMVVTALRDFLTEKRERPPGSGTGYRIEVILSHLSSVGVAPDTIAQFEFAFFPLLRHGSYKTSALYDYLGRTPAEFVNLVRNAYKSREPIKGEEPAGSGMAQLSYSILHDWDVVPGTDPDGLVVESDLLEWVASSRLLLSEAGRAEIGDEVIGQLLASGGAFAPEGWPSAAVKTVIERIGSRSIESGFYTGIVNGRGVTSRDPYDGGAQERALSARFRERATECSTSRRVARVLSNVADSYEREARNEDARAQWLADEG